MKKTKEKILNKARELFNEQGVAAVSIRQISRELNISHSNLIYHFKDKNVLLQELHQQILAKAIALNNAISTEESTLKGLFIGIVEGFKIIEEYRFFMIDLNLIMRENKVLHQTFLEIEKLRFGMYQAEIEKLISDGILREAKSKNEYDDLITHIRIISDYWVSSAQIYENGEAENHNKKYAKILLLLFRSYLTESGLIRFNEYLGVFGLD